jgi:hypothetical protein
MTEAQQLSKAENIIIQLGISALVVLVLGYVGYKIAMKLIDKWAERDAERNKTYEDGFRQITTSHVQVLERVNENHSHVIGVINAHQADELEQINNFRIELNRLDQKMSTALDLTPTRGLQLMEPSALDRDRDETPVDRPPVPGVSAPRTRTAAGVVTIPDRKPARTQTPAGGVKTRPQTSPGGVVTEYGPFQSRPKKG